MPHLKFELLATNDKYSVIRMSFIMKPRNNKNLMAMRAYRFNPTLAHSVYATARSLNMSESEFVRVVLLDAVDKIRQN
jgi:hypothetical protein